MVILQITTLDEFHECVVQAMFHFPALAALSIILASIVCIIIVAYKYKTKQIAKDEAVRYTGIYLSEYTVLWNNEWHYLSETSFALP